MSALRTLAGKTLFVTGASRGIGLAIAKRAARDRARIVLVAKSVVPNPKLPGTLQSAAAEIEAAGGEAHIVPTDIRDDAAVGAAVQSAIARFGGIDILVNNASALSLTSTAQTPMKRFDLMFGVNVRGTFACTQAVSYTHLDVYKRQPHARSRRQIRARCQTLSLGVAGRILGHADISRAGNRQIEPTGTIKGQCRPAGHINHHGLRLRHWHQHLAGKRYAIERVGRCCKKGALVNGDGSAVVDAAEMLDPIDVMMRIEVQRDDAGIGGCLLYTSRCV